MTATAYGSNTISTGASSNTPAGQSGKNSVETNLQEAETVETSDSEGREEGAVAPSGSRALVVAREVRERSRRVHRLRRMVAASIVAACVLLALGWGLFVLPPRYPAEARFAVRGSAAPVGGTGTTGLVTTGQPPVVGAGFVDGFAVNDFILTRDCMQQVAQRVDLAKLLLPGARDTSNDALFRAYRQAVASRFNIVEQENVVEISAFSPQASQAIGEAILATAQAFVARMDEQGVRNTLDVDARQLRLAEERSRAAASAVAAWRAANRNIDPEAEVTLVMTMIGQIEQELTTARINYEKILALGNPEHPMLAAARQQVAALERLRAEARARLTGGANSQAARLRPFTELKNAQIFADSNLTAARQAYQEAFHETARLRRYLTVIARALAQDHPGSPDFKLLALEGLLAGIVLAFIANLVLSSTGRFGRP